MAPEPAVCILKEKLLIEFRGAVSEYHRMQSAQLEALLKGDQLLFETEIAKANVRREEAKYALLAHLQEHGC